MKKIIISLVIITLTCSLFAQNNNNNVTSHSSEKAAITYNGSGNYELTERTDLRRYDNGKYTGLVSREISSFIIPEETDDGFLYDGHFFIQENTRRNMNNVAMSLNDSIPSVFKINSKGHFTMIEDNGFPSYRSFPTFPDKKIEKGESWTGEAERAIDPLNKGIVTKIPVIAQYTYTGDSVFYNEPVYIISAKWATRYGMGTGNYYIDWGGDSELQKATGSHNATIYVSKKTGNAVLIRDNVDETFFYSDGNQITFKGTVSQFTKYPPAIDRTKIIPALKRIADLSEVEDELSNINIKVDNTIAGLRLTIENLQFQPDSARLLPGDYDKLDRIAEVLKSIPNGRFLIEGHTASTGFEQGEMKLSLERAQSIAQEFAARGVALYQFICKGSGGKKPVAENTTAAGKAKNRRVEITILE